MSLITPDSGLIIWMTLIFGIVFFILAKFGFPLITSMVKKRNDYIGKSLSDAKKAQQQLETLALEHRKMIDQTRNEQARILNEAADARDRIISQAHEKAAQEASEIIARAKVEIEQQKENAMREVRREVAALSVDIAQKLVRTHLESSENRTALIDKLIDEARRNSAELGN